MENNVYLYLYRTQSERATTYSSEAVMPLVNNMSVILIIQLVGKVCAATGCTKHCDKTWIAAALLCIDNTMQALLQSAVLCHIKTHDGHFNLL